MVVVKFEKKGNSKLGRIWTWSIPSVITCPGRTPLCEKLCYAAHIEKWRTNVRTRYQANLVASRQAGFAEAARRALCRATLVRIHAAGDFYSARYAGKWLKIMKSLPQVKFYFYTRSWRVPAIRKVLIQMSRLRNVRAWWSVDRETGWPKAIPRRVRLAYLLTEHGEEPARPVDLTFRTMKLRRKLQLRTADGARVCPSEDGRPRTKKVSCQACAICFRDIAPQTKSIFIPSNTLTIRRT